MVFKTPKKYPIPDRNLPRSSLFLELCWNTYPSQNWSSATLHVCHLVLLVSLFLYMWKISAESKKNYSSTEDKDKNA